jgi:hypothetical protein
MAERKVYFHQVTDLDGNRFKPSFDGSAVLTALDNLVAAGDAEFAAMPGRVLVAKTLGQGRRGAHLALFLVQEEDLPYLYNNGQFSTLDAFISGGRVADPTYFAFFPNNVLAFVFSRRGPKPKGLARYLSAKLTLELDFPVIPRPGILDTVAEAGEVKLVDVKVPADSADLLGDDVLGRATRMLAETLQFADVELIFRARTKADRERFTRRIQEVLPSWLDSSHKAALKKAQAVLGSEDTYSGDRPLNLLEDLIVFQADIELVPGSRRYLEEADVMSELENAYHQVRSEIRRGLGGGE